MDIFLVKYVIPMKGFILL